MFEHIKISIRITVALLVITCVLYPLAVWGIGQVAFRDKANGSLITRNGKVIGSAIIGQKFAGERFFHGRPSNAGSDGYDASASGGTNWGPTSKKLLDAITERTTKYADTKPAGGIPADAVT
ncbi:MAG: potassium-transporting ATPase KdpC subunit, partial [Thermoanaerobaculia bacterium]|nr:potassium-transporting ATPase KdpC subunit [Thermoanaerobaculia bacterium]